MVSLKKILKIKLYYAIFIEVFLCLVILEICGNFRSTQEISGNFR